MSVTGGILLGSKSMSSIVNVPRTNFQVQEESKNRKRTEPSFERCVACRACVSARSAFDPQSQEV